MREKKRSLCSHNILYSQTIEASATVAELTQRSKVSTREREKTTERSNEEAMRNIRSHAQTKKKKKEEEVGSALM